MKTRRNFPINASQMACSPRAEEQQSCSQSFSICQRAVSWSLHVPVHGGKGLEALSFRPLFSKQ